MIMNWRIPQIHELKSPSNIHVLKSPSSNVHELKSTSNVRELKRAQSAMKSDSQRGWQQLLCQNAARVANTHTDHMGDRYCKTPGVLN